MNLTANCLLVFKKTDFERKITKLNHARQYIGYRSENNSCN